MSAELAKGSLQAIARDHGSSLAESFLASVGIVLIDVSSSMNERDAGDGRSRWRAASDELERVQAALPGKIALISFANAPAFCWNGILPRAAGSTNLLAALQFVAIADDCGLPIILISDGEPNDPGAVLAYAARFVTPLQCVYVGPAGSEGEAFLHRLARVTGGTANTTTAGQLMPRICGLLPAA